MAHFKEAKECNLNMCLGMTTNKQRKLNTIFEEHLIEELKWDKGEQYKDQNVKITFNTFLKANDPRCAVDDTLVDQKSQKSQQPSNQEWVKNVAKTAFLSFLWRLSG